jgi:hypothetical protein
LLITSRHQISISPTQPSPTAETGLSKPATGGMMKVWQCNGAIAWTLSWYVHAHHTINSATY